jgi:hypothetical protein
MKSLILYVVMGIAVVAGNSFLLYSAFSPKTATIFLGGFQASVVADSQSINAYSSLHRPTTSFFKSGKIRRIDNFLDKLKPLPEFEILPYK